NGPKQPGPGRDKIGDQKPDTKPGEDSNSHSNPNADGQLPTNGADKPGKPDTLSSSDRQSLEDLRKQLEEMTKPGQDARKQQQAAQNIRKRAEDLYNAATPEEKEQMRRWMQQAARGADEHGGGHGAGDNIAGRTPSNRNIAAKPAPASPDTKFK